MHVELTWDEWCIELNRLAAGTYAEHTEPECWRDYFDEGFEPCDALSADAAHLDTADL
jgi:hypothetical protein